MSYKGKAIYQPKGKAGEYSYWACNFYVGCSNGCTYCYLKKGRGAKILGGCEPKLKSCFKSEEHALEVFEKELKGNLKELQKHGLFFSFTTDPMLYKTSVLTAIATTKCLINSIPVKILTKSAKFQRFHSWFFDILPPLSSYEKSKIAFGFTLTGHDELEPNASTNQERIKAMKMLHEAGFKTFASIEPIIDFESAHKMIEETIGFCDLYKIGLESGRRYSLASIRASVMYVPFLVKSKVYFKDSLLKQAGISRDELPANCVNRDYNLFKEN